MMKYINFRRFPSIFQGSCSHIVVYIPWHASALGIKSKDMPINTIKYI